MVNNLALVVSLERCMNRGNSREIYKEQGCYNVLPVSDCSTGQYPTISEHSKFLAAFYMTSHGGVLFAYLSELYLCMAKS